MLFALLVIVFLILGYIGGAVLTYMVCYWRHGGRPEDRLSVISGWRGGDAGIMLTAWPVTLCYQAVMLIAEVITARLDVYLSPARKSSGSRSLRSGQDLGLYK